MSKFIKSIVVLFIMAAGAELAGMVYVSQESEAHFRALISFLNSNDAINTEVVSFNKGILKSEAVTRSKPKFIPTEHFVEVKHVIWHGPVIFSVSGDKPVDLQLAKIISVPATLPKSLQLDFTVTTILNYQGNLESQIQGTGFSLTEAQYKIQGQNWNLHANINTKTWDNIKGKLLVPATTVEIMGMAFQINDVQSKFDVTRNNTGSWLGDSDFNVGTVAAVLVGAELKNFKSSERSVLKQDLLDVDWNIAFEKFTLANVIYGPLKLDIQLNNLNPEVLLELKSTNGNLKKPDETFMKFLSKRPEILIKDSSLMLPQGLIKLDIGASLGGTELKLPIDNAMLEKTIEGHLMLSMPKELFKEALGMGFKDEIVNNPEFQKLDDAQKKSEFEKQLQLKMKKLIDDGIMSDVENLYLVKISIDKGKWFANGKEIPPLFTANP